MSRGRVEFYKEHYPAGTRICLDRMGDDSRSIPAGTKGTVVVVDDIGTVFVNFDCGRMLGVCPEADKFHKIFEQTESQEPKMSM
ncbi:MAG: DUF4314 domain-containing protein [Ruminococcaceae bacterium]|nr:DUF4314 domain-containing protein [Oscillospiraceae bacterium]